MTKANPDERPARHGRRWPVIAGVAMIAISAALLSGCDLVLHGPGGETGRAERRVRTVLENLVSQQGRGGRETDESTAMAAWWDGSPSVDDPVILARAEDEFRDWRERRGLIYGGLGRFEIVGSTPAADDGGPVVVSVTIDGEPFELTVRPGQPIR